MKDAQNRVTKTKGVVGGRYGKSAPYHKCLHLHICERTTKIRLTDKQVESVLKYGDKKSLRRRYLHATKGWKERAY